MCKFRLRTTLSRSVPRTHPTRSCGDSSTTQSPVTMSPGGVRRPSFSSLGHPVPLSTCHPRMIWTKPSPFSTANRCGHGTPGVLVWCAGCAGKTTTCAPVSVLRGGRGCTEIGSSCRMGKPSTWSRHRLSSPKPRPKEMDVEESRSWKYRQNIRARPATPAMPAPTRAFSLDISPCVFSS